MNGVMAMDKFHSFSISFFNIWANNTSRRWEGTSAAVPRKRKGTEGMEDLSEMVEMVGMVGAENAVLELIMTIEESENDSVCFHCCVNCQTSIKASMNFESFLCYMIPTCVPSPGASPSSVGSIINQTSWHSALYMYLASCFWALAHGVVRAGRPSGLISTIHIW